MGAEGADILLEARREVFDTLRPLFFGSDITITLLKPSETAREFDEIEFLIDKWFFEYSNFRKNFLLEIADDGPDIAAALAEATHVAIGDEVYVIEDGDPTPPLGTDVTWKVFCNRYTRRSQYAAL